MELKEFILKNERLLLSYDKFIFWDRLKILIISDVHLGKGKHFRKNGIPIPDVHDNYDLFKLEQILNTHQPKEVIFLGDLFHSVKNNSFDLFKKFIQTYPSVTFHLVEGNHDIMNKVDFLNLGIHWHKGQYVVNEFVFVHDIKDWTIKDKYALSGHIHPAIYLQGKARQGLRLPIFYFSPTFAILPAFGSFTGLKIIECTSLDKVFGIVKSKVIDLI